MLNGQPVVSVGGGNDTSASSTILIPANSGDRLWLQLNRGKLVPILQNFFPRTDNDAKYALAYVPPQLPRKYVFKALTLGDNL
jgi:hypothetical protein